jgi:prefoldin alpha subunit
LVAATGPQTEEELRRLSMEVRYYEQTVEALQQRLNMMNAAITDLTYANATLENIETEKENADMLVPIGGSSYVKVKLATADTVVVGMGAGVSIEKTVPEAKAIVKQRIEEIEKTRISAQQQLNQFVERINQGRNRMESLLSGIRQGTQ